MEIQVSGISSYCYCPINYLITYVLNMDDTNSYIIAGDIAHQNVDQYRKDIKLNGIIEYSRLAIHSEKYHLYGYCDLVSFIPDTDHGTFIKELEGQYRLIPIEYKVRYQEDKHNLYKYQCILQAICLEEMYGTIIDQICIYYADINKRIYETITKADRQTVTDILHEMYNFHLHSNNISETLSSKCRGCAKYYICYPSKTAVQRKSTVKQVDKYFENTISRLRSKT